MEILVIIILILYIVRILHYLYDILITFLYFVSGLMKGEGQPQNVLANFYLWSSLSSKFIYCN